MYSTAEYGCAKSYMYADGKPYQSFFFPYYRARDNINLDLAAVADLFQPLNAYLYGSINKIIGITII